MPKLKKRRNKKSVNDGPITESNGQPFDPDEDEFVRRFCRQVHDPDEPPASIDQSVDEASGEIQF